VDELTEERLLRRLWKENPILLKDRPKYIPKGMIMKETELALRTLKELKVSFVGMEEMLKRLENPGPTADAEREGLDIEMKNVQSLCEQLHGILEEIDKVIEGKALEIIRLVEKGRECEREIDSLIKADEIANSLRTCKADCEHTHAVRKLREAYEHQAKGLISNHAFHFFICHDSHYLGSDGKKPFHAHKDVIDEWRFSWLGKFVKERADDGQYFQIEPFGESMSSTPESFLARTIQETVRERVRNRQNVYLYLHNPNPPNIQLHVCNVLDFWFGEGEIPNGDEFKEPYPQCAHFPRYYFQKREKMCRTCTQVESTRCIPQFLSNFWFKIDKITEVENFNLEFTSLQNAHTMIPINFATPILYPLLVFRAAGAPSPFARSE
jgi:hypothetical protein